MLQMADSRRRFVMPKEAAIGPNAGRAIGVKSLDARIAARGRKQRRK